ncbi:MAG: hypothetical protein CVU42_12120 [Chloroflexi bacterium HGW-Chloroflexi-4]|nr:MAG: hypothetical protein CVU42_12120 [Chloroflexi bacterium HGW-Chloroflexi-4]
MITLRKCFTMILIVSVLITACSNVTTGQNPPAQTVSITLNTDPITPVVGSNIVIVDIQNNNGQPLSGAKVDVSADHKDMSGMSMTGLATEQSSGRYSITADFSMSGKWNINVVVQKESLVYEKDFELIIP